MESLWSDIRRELAQSMENAGVSVWLDSLNAEYAEGRLTLFAGTEFMARFVREHFRDDILRAAEGRLGAAPSLEIKARPRPESEKAPSRGEKAAELAPALPETQAERPGALYLQRPWRYSFEDFVVGPCNDFAYAAARSLCGGRSRFSDLVYLCSPAGMGKTHLLQAVGGSLSGADNLLAMRVEYLNATDFANQLRSLLRGNDMDRLNRFKERFRAADALLLENLHAVQKMEKTQNELLSIISCLLDKGGRVLLSSTAPPHELRDMDEQLRSRLASGIIAGIEPPDAETRLRIISRKAAAQQLALSEDIAAYLAEHMRTDVRRIEGCLHTLACKAKMLNRAISMDLARETLGECLGHSAPALPELIRLVCEGFGLTPEDLRSKSRKRGYVQARNALFHLARRHTDLSLQELGRRFNRSHSAVSKGIESLEQEMQRQSHAGRQLARTVELIERSGSFASRS